MVDKRKTPFSLSQRRELLSISSSSSEKHGRELTIKKKGRSFSKLQSLTRQVWSSLRPSEGNEKPLPRALKQEENPRQVTFAKRRDPLSRRELLYLLASLPPSLKTEESSLRLLVNKTELPSLRFPHVSSLPHSRQEENCLHTRTPSQNNRQVPQLHEKEEGCVYRSVGKKRHPFSLGKGNKRAPISSPSSEDRRELPLKKKGWSSADLQKEKSGPPSFKHEKMDPLPHVTVKSSSSF